MKLRTHPDHHPVVFQDRACGASATQQPVDPRDVMLEKGYSDSRACGQSKFAMVAGGFALAQRLDPDEVTVNSLHPGTMMPTKMVLARFGSSVDTLETGVRAVTALATDPALVGVSGRYFDRGREAKASAESLRPTRPAMALGHGTRTHRRSRTGAAGRRMTTGCWMCANSATE